MTTIPLLGPAAIATPLWLTAPLAVGIQAAVPRIYKIRPDPALKRTRALALAAMAGAWLLLGTALVGLGSSALATSRSHWPLPVGIALTVAVLAWTSASSFHGAQTEVLRTADARRSLETLDVLFGRLLPLIGSGNPDLSQTRLLLPAARRAVQDRAGADAVMLVKHAAVTLRQAVGPDNRSDDVEALDSLLHATARKLTGYGLRQ